MLIIYKVDTYMILLFSILLKWSLSQLLPIRAHRHGKYVPKYLKPKNLNFILNRTFLGINEVLIPQIVERNNRDMDLK